MPIQGMRTLFLLMCIGSTCGSPAWCQSFAVGAGQSIQATIDANPGKAVYLPAGDYPIDQEITISQPGSGLFGPGRIVQSNPERNIIHIKDGSHNRIEGLTLTRADDKAETRHSAIRAERCKALELANLRVVDNRGPSGAIRIDSCQDCTILNCSIEDYKGFTIDDRTKNPLMGYSFRCIDGTGIAVFASSGTLIQSNRITEDRLLPTRDLRDRHNLGEVLELPAVPGPLTPKSLFETKYTTNWHQGSGLIVGKGSSNTRIIGNYIRNAGQGLDIHSDYVIISNNIVDYAMMGMKAMHGAKRVLIIGNQFSHFDLWGVMLMPGANSYPAQAATDKEPAKEDNSDGEHIIANNIFSDVGYGNDYWIRHEPGINEGPICDVIAVLGGQLAENPPLKNVLITGNVVYDTGRDRVLIDGRPQVQAPRFRYALYIEQIRKPVPQDVLVRNNQFDTGYEGVSNISID